MLPTSPLERMDSRMPKATRPTVRVPSWTWLKGSPAGYGGGGQRQGKLHQIFIAVMQVVAVTAKEHTLMRTSLEKKAELFFSGQLRAVQGICKNRNERTYAFFGFLALLAIQQETSQTVIMPLLAEAHMQATEAGKESVARGNDAAERDSKIIMMLEDYKEQVDAFNARLEQRERDEKEERVRREKELREKKEQDAEDQ